MNEINKEERMQGLSGQQVSESKAKYGTNELAKKETESLWSMFIGAFDDIWIKVLCAALALKVILAVLGIFVPALSGGNDVVEIISIVIAIALATGFSTLSEYRNTSRSEALQEEYSKTYAKVVRDGKLVNILTSEIVKGDTILIQAGDKVPADGLLFEGKIKVSQAALNGESRDENKAAVTNMDEAESTDYSSHGKVFMGSVVTSGEGYMIATVIGDSSELGKINKALTDTSEEEERKDTSSLKLEGVAAGIGKLGVSAAAIAGILHVVLTLIRADQAITVVSVLLVIAEAVMLMASIVIMAVPEGLPMMNSLVQSMNTESMYKKNILVSHKAAFSDSAYMNVLFSDKTGTITKGRLEVVDFFFGDGKSVALSELKNHGKVKGLVDLAIGKNTQSMFDASHKVIGGNATDQALMKFIGESTFRALESDKECVITQQQGFNSSNKFSQARIESLGKTFYKGAPERLLGAAKHYLDADGTVKPLDMDVVNKKIDELAVKAMRVLAFGYSEKTMTENKINDDVVIIGLVGIRDDVRPEAKEAIAEVQGAGIQVVMITGDRLETAVAIAKDAGLLKNKDDKALSSAQLNEMSDDEVKKIIPHIRVIARALPTDKSRMVRLCQEMNLVVGMTGDGVNDSPALKRADVGFAMGSGTEAAKEAGEIVILDDNFKSIKDAILYGRTIYHNILKFCKFQLVINVTAVVVSAIAPFFGVEEPLKVTHLLFVNLVMDGLGAIMLGNEPALEKYMDEKPRRRDESIISKQMMGQILTMGLWLTVVSFVYLKAPFFKNLFENEEQHLTGYFVLFIVSALFNGFNVRDDGAEIFKGLDLNPGFLKVFFAIILVQAVIVNAGLIPFVVFDWIGEMFSCVPFGIKGWIAAILLAVTMIPVDLIRKAIVNKKH